MRCIFTSPCDCQMGATAENIMEAGFRHVVEILMYVHTTIDLQKPFFVLT